MTHPCQLNPDTFRLRVSDVHRLHAVLEGEPARESAILVFIQDKFGARSLLDLMPRIADQVLDRPQAFIEKAVEHCRPKAK